MRVPPSNSQTRYLARRPTERSRWPSRESGEGSYVFSEEKPSRSARRRVSAGEERVEPLGQRLHLGQFGHATMYA